MANLVAPNVQQQAVSVTRKMSASLPGLRDIAASEVLKCIIWEQAIRIPSYGSARVFAAPAGYFDHLREREGLNDPDVLPEYLREAYSYGYSGSQYRRGKPLPMSTAETGT